MGLFTGGRYPRAVKVKPRVPLGWHPSVEVVKILMYIHSSHDQQCSNRSNTKVMKQKKGDKITFSKRSKLYLQLHLLVAFNLWLYFGVFGGSCSLSHCKYL